MTRDFLISGFCFIFVISNSYKINNMKKLIVSIALFAPILSFSQTKMGNFAHISSSRDTLFLLENDKLANITYEVWKKDTTWNGCNPTILFVNVDQMSTLKKDVYSVQKDFVRMRKTPIKPKNK